MLPWIVILSLVGLLLVISEFLMPGFGVFGILGTIALLGSTLIIAFEYGTTAFLIMVVILIAIMIVVVNFLKKSNLYRRVILTEKQEAKDFDENTIADLLYKEGVSITQLKPYGKVLFSEREVDVFSEGDFVEKNKGVKVIRITGKNVIVRQIK